MLTLGWSDGCTFMPIDFSLLSSVKTRINGIRTDIDKRISGDKRRVNALQTAPAQIPDMIRRALSSDINANYVLVDSWFTMPPLVKGIVEQSIDVIGMVKAAKQRYFVAGELVDLKKLYRPAQPEQGKKSILRSINCEMANGIPAKIVFIQNRNKKSNWLAILSTDCTLSG